MIDLAKILLTALSLVLLNCGGLLAQNQDPFGADPTTTTGSDPFAAGDSGMAAGDADPASAAPAGPATPATNSSLPDPDPLVNLLRTNPPKTPAEFAETLQWMSRIQRWDEVARYIDLLQKRNWSQDQLAEVSLAGGSDLWFKLRDATTELKEPQRNFIRDIASLPAKLARDPQWLDGWINRLATTTAGERREAQLRLMRGQKAAVERLIGYVMNGHPRVHGALLVNSLLQFDNNGVEALRAACVSPDATLRGRTLLAIAQSPAAEFGAEFGAALQDESLPAATRQAISDALIKKYGKLPAPEAVRDYVAGKFKHALDEYQLLRSRPARLPATVWRLAVDGKRVVAVDAPVPDHTLEAFAQLATHRLLCMGTSHQEQIDCATVLAQHAYQINMPFSGYLAQTHDSAFWKQVLDRSTTWQMHGAAMRATEALGRTLPDSLPGDASFDFIAACLRDSRPAMRYLAVQAIAKANLKSAYNGSATALETALEMSRLGQGPMVLVLGLSSDLRLAAEQQLLSIGAQAIAVNSTADALQVLDEPNPIEYIMVVDRLPRNSILTSVDRLRHSKRGGSLPVAILTDDLNQVEKSELSKTAGIVMSVLSETPDQMPRVIAELERRLDTRPISPAERQAFAETAHQFLATISSDRQQYAFYELARWEKELASIADTLPTDTFLTMLGGMGTVSSQLQLINLASDRATSADSRKFAADSFAQSVSAHGVLLNRASVVKAYDVYNKQGPTDAVTVAVLGKVLDAIETKSTAGTR